MEEQTTHFDVTPDGVILLAQILETALDSVVPDYESRESIPDELQGVAVQVAGALVVEILKQVEDGGA